MAQLELAGKQPFVRVAKPASGLELSSTRGLWMRASAIRQFATTAGSILLCLSACTTLSPVAVDATGERIRTEIKAGDTVRVLTADGTTYRMQVTAVGASSLVGNPVRTSKGGPDVAGSPIDQPYRDIRQIDVQRVSSIKTTAIAVVLLLAAALRPQPAAEVIRRDTPGSRTVTARLVPKPPVPQSWTGAFAKPYRFGDHDRGAIARRAKLWMTAALTCPLKSHCPTIRA